MYMIKAGSPVQRVTSDGFPFTDRTDGKSEVAEIALTLYPELVLLTPDQNNGKWLFQMGTQMNWEVDAENVISGSKRLF